MNFLSNDERIQLKVQHKQERDKRVCDRIKAVLQSDKGWATTEIAEALLLSEDAIRDHSAEYEKLKKNLPQNETICFMDGVHPTYNVQSGSMDGSKREKGRTSKNSKSHCNKFYSLLWMLLHNKN